MKTKFLAFLAIFLAITAAKAQFVLDCACLAKLPGMTVTNCQATVPDLCAVATNCFRSSVTPPPPMIVVLCLQTPPAGTLVGPGTHMISLTVQLAGATPAQCAVPFTVVAPVTSFSLQCATNKTVNCDAVWSFDPPTPVNPCCPNAALPNGGVTISVFSTVTNGVCPQVITRVWQAVDNCGQTATCSQTVTVVDNVPPTINCGQNETVVCGQGWGFTVPIISDNCTAPSDLVLTIVSTTTNLTCGQTYVATRVWKVTDACGNSTTCTQVVTVVDFLPPTIICASNKAVPCGSTLIFDLPTAFEICLTGVGNSNVTIAVVSTVTNSLCPLIVTRTWSATDACGNASQCSQTVTAGGPGGLTLNCAALAALPELQTNACDGFVPALCARALALAQQNCLCPLTCNQSPAPGTQYGPGTYPITVTVSDGNGGTATCSVNFVVTAPPGGCATNTCCPPCPAPFPSSFTITVNPGYNALVNPLCHGSVNTVGTVLALVPDQSTISIWDKNTSTFITDIYDVNFGGWGNPSQPLDPGVGFFLFNPGPAYTLTFVGCEPQCPPRCPKTNETCFVGNTGSAPGTSTWQTLFGTNCPPLCGSTVSIFNPITAAYDDYVFLNGAWSPSTPSWPNGTSVFVSWRANTNCLPCPPTLTATLNTGTTNGNGGLLLTGALEQVWVNVAAPGGPMPMVVGDTNLWPIISGPWLQPTATSAWVSPSVGMQGLTGLYTNRVIFDAKCDRVCLTGRIASDDDGYLYVNGVFVTGSGFTAWSNVNHCADFKKGPNVIEFVVNNAGGPTGFRTELEFYEQCCCNIYTNVWNTGMDGTNALAVGQPDPNYALISGPGNCTGPAQVVGNNPTQWVPNGPNSQWIGGGPSAYCDAGVYHYRLCFYLPCVEGASVVGQWTSDDFGVMQLNGQTVSTTPSLQYPFGFTGWHPVALANGLICGTNYLDIYVTNAHGVVNPTGFRAELTNVFDDCCCGPLRDTSSYHSGVNANGLMPLGSFDPGVVLSCAPPGVATGPAQVTNPNPFWMPNGPDSQWLAPVGNPNLPGGLYCYTYRFNLPPCTNGTPHYAVKGQWAGDDAGTIYVNGIPTGNNLPNGWAFTNWHPISITSGLVPGVNFLTFYVTNASAGDTGIRVELTNSASCCDCTNLCKVTIACPPDIDRTICTTSELISYPTPLAISGCGSTTTVVCVPPSPSVFPLGTTTVTCTATDAAGNSATCSFKVILRPDITPPVVDCACLQSQVPLTVRACSAVIPNLCFAQCYSDNCTPAAQLICTQSPPAGTVVPGGASYLITVTVTDVAGNSSQCQVGFTVIAPTDTRVWNTGGTGSQAANFTVIQTPGGPANIPAVLTSPAGGAWSPNTAASSWVSFTPNSQSAAVGVYVYRLTFNLPCTNGASINGQFMSDDSARIWLNGVPTAALSTSFSAWTPVSLTSGFVSGLNTLDIYVTNAIIWTGIRTELTNNFNCCCPQAITLNCPRQALRGWVCGDGLASVPFNVTGTSFCSPAGDTVNVTCVPPSPEPFPVGTTTVTCTATDNLGNTTSCSFPVVVVSDTVPPVITCPGPITRVLCVNSVAVYYKVIARDDCSPTVTVTCVPPSGTVFTAGTTIVTCTARDACGNTATCSFPVKVINNSIWQTLPIGINDCYAQSGWEPNYPGACLNTAYPGANWKNFDITTVNKWVGHTWSFPVSWNILAAQLATRARPPINGCSGISDNDSMSLGLANCTTPSWLWSRYLGSGNASPGLVQKQWCNGSDCQYLFNFDLALMPLTPSGTISLLPHMNGTKRLDMFFQDDTTVDFAQLRVLRCAPSHVIGGLGSELASARLVYGPISWCLVRDTDATPSFSARFSVGEADGLRLPIEPLMLSEHPGSALALGEVVDGIPADRLRVSLQDDGNALVSLGELPAGVTHIDVQIEVNGEVVQSFPNLPVTAGQPIVNFPGTEPLIELATANGNEVLASILSQDPGQPAEKQTLRVRHLGRAKRSEAELNLNAVNLPEIGVQTPELQTALRESPTRRTKVGFSSSDDAIAEVSGGQCVVNPLYEGAPVSVSALFEPTDEFRAVTPPPFGTFGPVPGNAVVRNIVRGLIGGEEVDVDQVEFTRIAGGWDVGWSSARLHPVRRIYWVYGPSGAHRFEASGSDSLPVIVDELPNMVGKLGGRTPCRRMHWPKPITMSIGGESFEANELRILVEVDNYPVTALTGLRLEATGAESLMVSGLGVGPEEYRLEIPELTPDGLWLRWTGFGGLLQEAPTVLGPWAPTPGQFEQTPGEVLTPHDPVVPAKFFRVRGL